MAGESTKRRQEQITFRVELAGDPPANFQRAGVLRIDAPPSSDMTLTPVPAHGRKLAKRRRQRPAPADADGQVVAHHLRQELAERQTDRLHRMSSSSTPGWHDRLVEAEGVLEPERQFDAFGFALVDPDPDLAAFSASSSRRITVPRLRPR